MRVLATCAASFSAAVFLACTLNDKKTACGLCLAAIIGGAVFLLLRNSIGKRCRLVFFSLAAGFLLFAVFFSGTEERAQKLADTSFSAEVRLTAEPVVYSDYVRLKGKIRSGEASGLTVIFYDNSCASQNASVGDTVTVSAKWKSAGERYGERYDSYYASGIFLIGSGEVSHVESGAGFLRDLPAKAQSLVCADLKKLFGDGEFSAFFQALLAGEKTEFNQQEELKLAFSRAGLLHMVAVSGMHIAFLIPFLQMLFGKTRRASLLCLCTVWFFVLMTGASPSAVRAGFMQSMLLIAPFFKRENDGITSLFFALMLILVMNPYASLSVSLQLSFSAMLGILLFSERITGFLEEVFPARNSEKNERRMGGTFRRYLIGTVALSLSVMILSVPLTALHFTSVPILSVVSNLLVLWAVSACFFCGWMTCILARIWLPAGAFLAKVAEIFAGYIFSVTKGIAKLPFSTVYLSHRSLGIAWVAFTYLLIFFALAAKKKTKEKVLLPAALSLLSLVAILVATNCAYKAYDGVFTAVDVDQGQSLCAFTGDSTVVIDCGNTSSLKNAGEEMGEYLLSRGRTKIDLLILTHPDEDHISGIETLMLYLPVRKIVTDASFEENSAVLELEETAFQRGTEVAFVDGSSSWQQDGLSVQLVSTGMESGKTNDNSLFSVVGIDGYEMLVTGDATIAAEKRFLQIFPADNLDLLIVGHHGSKYATSQELLSSIGARTAIISCGYNTYGHPTWQTLHRLSEENYQVYRTDLNGTVEIRLA